MVVETLLPTEPTYPTAPPTRHRMMAVRPGRCIVLAAMLAATGCGEPDAIRVEDEPALPQPAVPPIPADKKQFRTLAAMVPVDGAETRSSWWFFKLSGPAATIGKYEADFDKLLDTVLASSDEKNPITWELPKGWTRQDAPPGGMRFATLKAPGDEVEIAVTRFGGSVLANAQRWWSELWGKEKSQELTVAMLPEYVHQRTVKGRLILRVDMFGPNEPPKRPMMMNPNPHGGM
jgi:hypothetical protein